MAFDPATLLSRTNAGDAELRTPQNGLSLGQRKVLTFLEQPQALEEFAARHGLERDKLDRDLAKLASLNLLAIDGETSANQASTIVLGGLRGPSAVMRYALVPLLLVGAAIVYFVLVPGGGGRKPATSATPIAAAPARPAPSTGAAPAASGAGATPAGAISSNPLAPALAAAVDLAPRGRDMGSARAIDVARAAHPATDARNPVLVARESPVAHDGGPVAAHVDATRSAAAGDTPPRAVPPAGPATASAPASAASSDQAAGPTTASAAGPRARADVASSTPVPTAAIPVVAGANLANANVPAPSAAVKPQAVATVSTPEPMPPVPPAADAVKLAMAAPTSTDAHPAGHAKLLPVSREDPAFPREAITRGVADGTVKALLAIDAAGKVTGVRIVDAQPARVFDRAVKDALARWTFPAGDAGRSTEVEIAFRRN